ncbi:MAG: flagellar basal body P-ring formation protein FlgA [Rhodospirillales bacterium]|nr:flagellar basal body P-ring formation protein FlgA [Alphaproteobacteria bacterium]MCB1840435.1 flagellar basal body P-ring formation protein FlgA [Alphaproteobacteria bacterium]MCB9976204.1 flagellar basal body P-ring formation protein FlgA [Rhodospirillales bacterium]
MKENNRHTCCAHPFVTPVWVLVCTLLLILPVYASSAMGLKENVVVTGNTITLGDVFYGLQRDQDRVLGVAPRPGQDMVLNARTLLRIAIALDLPWRPSSSADQVTIRREATVIGLSMIEDHLKEAIAKKGYGGSFSVRIPPDYAEIVLPREEPASLDVTNVTLNRNNNTFEATVAAPSANNPIQKFQVSGTIHPLIMVPVLKENIQNGHVISASDLDFIHIEESNFLSGTIVDEQALIGMTPRRFAIAGRPLRPGDLTAPKIVSRGELVTVILDQGPLSLTTKGKALENGAKGETIRVVNTSSNVTIEAVVTGVNEVRVVAD